MPQATGHLLAPIVLPTSLPSSLSPNGLHLSSDPLVSPRLHVPPPHAGRPGSLSSCTITNVTTHSLMVRCEPGADGGARQSFVMELTDAHSGRVVTNVTADVPRWVVTNVIADVLR